MKYRFLEHTADAMFEAFGDNLEQLFENSALAVEETMVDIKSVKQIEEYDILLNNKEVEGLLYDFLSELLFLKDTENLLFSKFHIRIHCIKGMYELIANCFGEKINPKKHKLVADTKAITLHEFKVEQTKNGWMSKVIVDI